MLGATGAMHDDATGGAAYDATEPGHPDLWTRLIEPPASLRAPALRRRARLLNGLVLAVVPIIFLSSLILPHFAGTTPLADLGTSIGFITSLGGIVAYLVNRRGHYTLAAATVTGLAMYGVWARIILAGGTPTPAPYFVALPIILAAALSPMRHTLAIAAMNLAGLLGLALFDPAYAYFEMFTAIMLVSLVSAFVLVFAALRDDDLAQLEVQSRDLAASEARQRAITDNAPDTILMIDRQGTVLYVNHLFPGLEPQEVLGQDIVAFAMEDDRDRLRGIISEVFATGKPRSYEISGPGPHGRVSWYSSRLGPIIEDGKVVAATLIAQDVTELKEAQAQQLQKVENEAELERLREVARFKNEFINMAAHELYTPMTPAILALQMLKDDPETKDDKRRLVETIARNIDRMQRILKDLLESARLQNDKLTVSRTRLDLGRTADEAVLSYQTVAEDHGVGLTDDVANGTQVEGDPQRIEQIIGNLIDNAIKFTPRGGRVHVEVTTEEGEAVVRVEDTGRGLTEEQIQQLFLPFSQVHDRHEVPDKGTGLGLYITKRLVELHGGRIWCTSPGPAKGSTFAFALPLSPRQTTAPSSPVDGGTMIGDRAEARRETIHREGRPRPGP